MEEPEVKPKQLKGQPTTKANVNLHVTTETWLTPNQCAQIVAILTEREGMHTVFNLDTLNDSVYLNGDILEK